MGNCAGKKSAPKDAHHLEERRKVFDAQDSFVRKLVDPATGDEIDSDSIGPATCKQKKKKKESVDIGIDDELDWDPNEVYPLLPGDESQNERRKGLRRLRTIVSETFDEIDSKVVNVDLTKYTYPFENLIFEGGGNKGLAYCGAIRVLEELGIYGQVKRYAGSSAGAMTAALLAVGYDSHEIEKFLSQNLSKIFLDHSCGYFSLLPNLIKGYGWNPGQRIFNWFGAALEEKTDKADITFAEVYERYGKELCVVVTNLNMMNAEYFHPKTTPDTPVRVAVRMSMAIPGMFQACRYVTHGQENTYVDGGVLCNYPISCYDGWWLSMKMKDSFLNRLQPLENFPRLFEKKERFGTYNENTLGFLLYADNERDILRDILQTRVGTEMPPFPDTALAREKMRKKKLQEKVKLEHIRNLHAVSAFLKVLRKHNDNEDDKINKSELEKALNDDDFPKRYAERLFGRNVTLEEAMAALDEDGNGEIYYHELVHFIERTGVSLQARFLGYQRKEITGLFSFFDTLQSALLTNVKRVFVEERDIDRTVGINTGHVGTSDFKLDPADREFVVEQGRRSTEAFLRYFVVKSNPPMKDDVTLDTVKEANSEDQSNSSEQTHESQSESVKQIQTGGTPNGGGDHLTNGIEIATVHVNGVTDKHLEKDETKENTIKQITDSKIDTATEPLSSAIKAEGNDTMVNLEDEKKSIDTEMVVIETNDVTFDGDNDTSMSPLLKDSTDT